MKHSNQGWTPQTPQKYSVHHDGTFKDFEDVSGSPKGEHVCMQQGQLPLVEAG
jgi:hypothetical protein